MQKSFLLFLSIILLFGACTSNEADKPFANYEKFMSEQKLVLDSLPDSLAMTIENFVKEQKPADGAHLTWVAANLHSKGGRLAESAASLESIARDYPESSYAADALISAAVNYENLGMIDHAKKAYGRFLDKYPQHKMHDEIQQVFDMLGDKPKSADEQLNEILKNKK